MVAAMTSKTASAVKRSPPAVARGDVAPANKGRGRPVGDRDAKRGALLKAAIEVIAREGYGGATLRKVAMQAGYTTGAVTYYFADKDAMVTAVARHIWDKWDSMRSGPGQHDEGLRRFLAWSNADDATEWMASMEILIHTRHVPAFQEMYVQRYGDYRDAMTRSLEISQRNGLVRSDIPADMLTDQICAMADGWMLAMPSDPKRFTPKRISDLVDATMTLIKAPHRG